MGLVASGSLPLKPLPDQKLAHLHINQLRSLLRRPQRRVAWSHDLSNSISHRTHEEEQGVSFGLELISLANLDDE